MTLRFLDTDILIHGIGLEQIAPGKI